MGAARILGARRALAPVIVSRIKVMGETGLLKGGPASGWPVGLKLVGGRWM